MPPLPPSRKIPDIAGTTLNVWKATAIGAQLYLVDLGYTDPILQSTINIRSMLMLEVWEHAPQGKF